MNSLASSKPGTPKVSGTTSPQEFAKKRGFYIRAFWIFPLLKVKLGQIALAVCLQTPYNWTLYNL